MANQGNRQAVVKNAMERAKKLLQLESNGTIDKIAADPNFKANINNSLDGNVSSAELMTTARNRNVQAPIQTRQMGQNASNVPQAIREAFMNNPIDDSALYAGLGDGRDLSFLDEGKQQVVQPTQNVRQIVNEGMSSQPQVTQQIDYPMIRTIVEEIVRKYAVSLNKKIINESKQSGNQSQVNTIALGKTFKFLTENGDMYECTMKKVGNIKNKKNVNG